MDKHVIKLFKLKKYGLYEMRMQKGSTWIQNKDKKANKVKRL